MLILKQPKPKNTATKSKKYHKNNKNIFGGVKRPRDDKKFKAKNDIKRPRPKNRLIFGLLAGHDMAFIDNQDLKQWLNEFKHSINRPVNVKHNLNYKDSLLYHDKEIYRFDMMIRDREF